MCDSSKNWTPESFGDVIQRWLSPKVWHCTEYSGKILRKLHGVHFCFGWQVLKSMQAVIGRRTAVALRRCSIHKAYKVVSGTKINHKISTTQSAFFRRRRERMGTTRPTSTRRKFTANFSSPILHYLAYWKHTTRQTTETIMRLHNEKLKRVQSACLANATAEALFQHHAAFR